MNLLRVILLAVLGVVVLHSLHRYTAHNDLRALRRVLWLCGLMFVFELGWRVCPEVGVWAVAAVAVTRWWWRILADPFFGRWRLVLRAAVLAVCFWPLTFGASASGVLRSVSDSFWRRVFPPPPISIVNADGSATYSSPGAWGGPPPSVFDIAPYLPALLPGLVCLAVGAGFVSWLRERVAAGERWPGLVAGRRRRVGLGVVAALLLLGLNWYVAGWVPVYTQAQRGRVWVVRYVFWSRPESQRWGGDDAHGLPPLLAACHARQTEAVRTLLAAGADPNVRFWSARSPLGLAIYWGDMEIARLLLAAGADVNFRDSEDKTTLDDARDDAMCALLRAYGGKTAAELKAAAP